MSSQQLLEAYQKAVDRQQLQFDDSQWQALQYLQATYDALIKQSQSFWRRWWAKPVAGVYLYGPVGSGKTYLLDLFFQTLPLQYKKRVHFHRFMAWVRDQIADSQAPKDPLKAVAKAYADECRLLCFDEFYVSNIADAMILGELLQGLYENGVTIVMSSNVVPDRLYEGGLNRERFLPAIELIKQKHYIVKVDNQIDYRYSTTQQSMSGPSRFWQPITEKHYQAIWQMFDKVAQDEVKYNDVVQVNGRQLHCLARSSNSIVFDFKSLCTIPRSQRDYLILAQTYQNWFVLNIPAIGRRDHTLICNFIKLIDILYDNGNSLWVLADVPIEKLYVKGKHSFAFRRAQSRLQAMQEMS